MIIKRDDLISKLKKCLPGIDRGSSSTQGADCFVFHQDKLVTFNDYISVAVPLESGMSCAVPALDFYKVLTSFKAKDIELVLGEFSLDITCGKATVSIPLMLEEKVLSRFETIFPEGMEWNELSVNFKKALTFGLLKSGNSQISGPFVDGTTLLSTDQIVIVSVDMVPPMERFWLSNKVTGELLKYPDFSYYATNSTWIHFKSDELTFSCRKLRDENYPKENVMSMLSSFEKGEVVCSGVFTEEVLDALKSATVFAEEADAFYMVVFSFIIGMVSITSKKHTGSFSQDVALAVNGDPISFNVDALKLRAILALSPEVSFRVLKVGNTIALCIYKDTWRILMGVTSQEAV